MKKSLLVTLLLFLVCLPGFPFGKNKINYYDSDWKVLETTNFVFYVTAEVSALSNEIVSTAESIFEHHKKALGYTPKNKIKVVIYNNQIDFQQNNISDSWIGEGTGGFTEFIKGRVVIPYSGNFSQFRHVLSHELVHAFQAMIWGDGVISLYLIQDIMVPLWMIEGAAEYVSIGLDNECEMMIASAVIDGNLPSLAQLSDEWNLPQNYYFYIYKEGQMFYHFATEKYGTNIVSLAVHAIGEFRDLNGVFTNLFKKDIEKVNAEFFDYLKKKYLPSITNLTDPLLAGSKLMQYDSYFNMNPVYIDSNRIAFISDRMIYPSIVVFNKATGALDRIVKGGFEEDYLEFHYGARNNLSVSTNGKLCFVSRSGGKDVIHLYDLATGNVQKIALDFRIIDSPDISKDGTKIVFSAMQFDQYDIYIYSIPDGQLTRLFDDKYFDSQPRWIGQDTIVFVSDRSVNVAKSGFDLFIYDLRNMKFVKSIDTGYSDSYPTVSPDMTKIAFIRNSINPSIMVYDIAGDTLYEELVPEGAAYAPSFGPDNKLVYIHLSDMTYNLYEYTAGLKKSAPFTLTKEPLTFQKKPSFKIDVPMTNKNYGLELSIDNVFGLFSFNSEGGTALLGLLNMSDLLGNHRIQIMMDMVVNFSTNMLEYINFDVSYYLLKYRSDFGIRLYHYSNYFYEFSSFQSFFDMEKRYRETWGVFLLYQYPFDTFTRIEASLGVKDFSFIDGVINNGTNYYYELSYQHRDVLKIAYVHDSTLWDYTGPVDGVRCEFSLSKGFKIFPNSISYERFLLDFRYYLLITPGYSLAFRGVAGMNLGMDKDAYPFSVGGFNSIRGYDTWSFSGDTMLLFNFEFRFPLVINMVIGLPFPIPLPVIWGTFFVDVGCAWNRDDPFYVYEYKGYDLYLRDLKIGFGFGLRMVLIPGIKLMVDIATPYDGFAVPLLEEWITVWQVGVDF
ncbi:MAG: hypothetical protein A2Y33_13475 [Spirochaetes bacterium GWF1_51_8]|nr:MAG: hypothetical protein A2Y33_13475 [Spirochaetes bacterium GWF1_51_8]